MKNYIICLALLIGACQASEDKKSARSGETKDVVANAPTAQATATPDPDAVPARDTQGRRGFAAKPITTLAEAAGLKDKTPTVRPDLADLFCVHAYKLPLRANFDKELAVLCTANKPNGTFADLDRHAQIVGEVPRSVKLSMEQKGAYTEAVYATVYALKIPPKWVKSGKIHEYMMTPSYLNYVTLDGKVTKDLTADVGGDLQFSRLEMAFKTDVKTPDGKPFVNERKTEFNGYQVNGGNPDIGIGTEHLIGGPTADYPVFNTITVTIGDKAGGSLLITIIRMSVKNNGYLDLADKVISDTATAQATNVHDGLKQELANYVTH